MSRSSRDDYYSSSSRRGSSESNSRDAYYSSSSRSRSGNQYPNLPPIRDVVGGRSVLNTSKFLIIENAGDIFGEDVLQQPARPSSGDDNEGHRSMDRSYTLSPQPHASSVSRPYAL
jgi:hypothetical protein